ncbi:hypothetical protein [Sinorhizobium glycinis]|uniref:hypothetical protein n=1 Tax=Sinorhizobium glycinis TaxID=1472378 RepID=UPI0012E8954A|nr:hypothetical protein [Sinorhizobium glycinis]
MAKVQVGDTIIIRGKVTRVGEDGLVSAHFAGVPYPVSLYEEDIEEIQPGKKEREPRNRKRPIFDKPD